MSKESSTNKNSDNESPEESEVSESTSTSIKNKLPANRNSLIIRGIVIVGLVYFAVTEFVLKEETPVETPQVKIKPRVKKIIPKAEVAPEADLAASAPKEEDPHAPVTAKEEQAPVETINVSKKEDEVVPAPVEVPEVQIPEKDLDKKIDELISKEEQRDPRSGERKERKQEKVDLKDKIVIEENYIEPPAYDLLGRGLVYNCKDKFWSCVSKVAYIQCNKNMKWNEKNNKTSECAVVNVYNSDEDCTQVQKYNVTTTQPTPFCKQ